MACGAHGVRILKEEWQIKEELEKLANKLAATKCILQPIKEQKVGDWERHWGVQLPETYRRFITEIADGLVLPRRSITPLRQSMTTARGSSWLPEQLPHDFLQKPFLHADDFNPDFIPDFESISLRMSDEEYSMWWLQHLHGTILLSDHGGDKSSFLVVTGEARGQVWVDLTVVGDGYQRAEWDFLDWVLRLT